MAEKKYKAVVIGCGKIGAFENLYGNRVRPATHAGAYRKNPRIILSALADANESALLEAGKFFPGADLFSDARKMLGKIRPDIVSIATPTDTHSPMVKLAAEFAPKIILCEKPLAESIKDAEEMISICKKNKILLLVNYPRHYDPLTIKWREKIKNGMIGEIHQVTVYYYNGSLNIGTHAIDLLRFFLGEAESASGFINKKTSKSTNDENVDGIVFFKNGARVVLQSLPPNYGFFEICFYGEKGKFCLKNLGFKVECSLLEKNKNFKGYGQFSQEIRQEGDFRSWMAGVVKNIVRHLDGQATSLSTGEDSINTLKIIFAVRRSALNNGKSVKIQ